MKKTKILITGGHITPAIATIEELQKQKSETEIIVVGREYAIEGTNIVSEESHLIRSMGIRFMSIQTGRLTRTVSLQSFVSVLRIPWGFIQSLAIMVREKPTLIVSFGGYIALPIVVAGWLVGVTSVTHEQTRTIGLANKIIALFAKRVFVSFPDQVEKFAKKKVIYTGLPIRSIVFHPPNDPTFTIATQLPIIYISGGTTGAASVNELFYPIIPDLCKEYSIVHQTGKLGFHKAQKILLSLPETHQDRYVPITYLLGSDYSWIMHHTQLLIGRSGANTVGETSAVGVVAIWIPLPWSGAGEQMANARNLEKYGTSLVLEQKYLTHQSLLKVIKQTMANRNILAHHAREYAQKYSRDSAQLLAQHVFALCTPPIRP